MALVKSSATKYSVDDPSQTPPSLDEKTKKSKAKSNPPQVLPHIMRCITAFVSCS